MFGITVLISLYLLSFVLLMAVFHRITKPVRSKKMRKIYRQNGYTVITPGSFRRFPNADL